MLRALLAGLLISIDTSRWRLCLHYLVTAAWYGFLLAVIVFIAWLAAHTGVN